MPLSKRQIWLLAIALATLILISLFAAPGGNRLQSGSTYGRSPDGYGAWYAFMESRGVTIQRWQKPLKSLFQPGESETPAIDTLNFKEDTETRRHGDTETALAVASPPHPLTPSPLTSSPPHSLTLLQIGNGIEPLSLTSRAWVERGNVLVLLGVRTPATKAPFDSTIASAVGGIHIQTSRRDGSDANSQPLLRDSFGSVVWQETVGRGRVIYAATPDLAANAYQDAPGNFEFLATIVKQAGLPIWVDEYSHGYKDADTIKQETSGNLLGYLAKTPLLLVAIQAAVLLLVLIWGQNRRMGPAIALATPAIDNSEAYIQAMAGVLRKAESSQFVMDTVSKAEQIEVQKALGLGTEPCPLPTLLTAWTQQTGQPAATLETFLSRAKASRRVSEAELLRWLDSVQTVRRQLATQK